MAMSSASRSPRFGCCTLIATVSPLPPCNFARCTWPIEPDASGLSSKLSKIDSRGWPKEASMALRVKTKGWAGAWLVSVPSASQKSSSNKSYRVEAHWPHLMPTGPHWASEPIRRLRRRWREKYWPIMGSCCRKYHEKAGPRKTTSSRQRHVSFMSQRKVPVAAAGCVISAASSTMGCTLAVQRVGATGRTRSTASDPPPATPASQSEKVGSSGLLTETASKSGCAALLAAERERAPARCAARGVRDEASEESTSARLGLAQSCRWRRGVRERPSRADMRESEGGRQRDGGRGRGRGRGRGKDRGREGERERGRGLPWGEGGGVGGGGGGERERREREGEATPPARKRAREREASIEEGRGRRGANSMNRMVI
eukprot:scaffold169337_cov28-Tisochrysis_lutea.AAC.1